MSERMKTIPEFNASVALWYYILCCPITCGLIPYKTTLRLDDHEITKTDVDLCGMHTSKRTYGDMGSVDRGNCFCCVYVESAFGPISPGCGCENEKVDFLVSEINERMRTRGEMAQLLRAEQTIQKLQQLENKLDMVIRHLRIPEGMTIDER